MTSAIPRRVTLAIAAWALLATLTAASLSVALERRYLDHNPYFFDAVSYSFYNAKLYLRLQDVDLSRVVADELSNNNRHPLRTVPLLVLAPKLLAHPFGHMATSLPALFVFIFLLGWTVYARTRRLLPAVAGSSVIVLLPGLYEPVSGIAAYWLDLPAALLIGASMLALLNSDGARDFRWLVAFVVLGSCAAFVRYISVAYLLFAAVPVFAWYLVGRVMDDGNWLRSVAAPFAVVAGSAVAVAGPYLFWHVGSVGEFYRLYGYALGAPYDVAALALGASFIQFVRPAGIILGLLLVGVCATLALAAVWRRKAIVAPLLVRLWVALAVPVFLVFVVKTSAIHTVSYAVILLLVAVMAPCTKFASRSALLGRVGIVIVLVFAASCGGYYKSAWKDAAQPSEEAAEAKALQTALADRLVQLGPRIVWNAYFDEISWLPSLDAFFRHGILPLPLGQDYVFSIHETVYKGNYPGWSTDDINAALVDNANRWLDVAVVFDRPEDAERYLPNSASRSAARHIAESVRQDPDWVKEFEIETVRYGRLAGYRNRHAERGNYDAVLSGRVDLRPANRD